MKYYSDQAGIINRYLSEKENWDNHLENTKEFITDCLANSPVKTIAILGSGWLLDVPLEFLSGSLKKIYLFDINHPAQIVNKVKKYENIELISADITGGMINTVYSIVGKWKKNKEKVSVENIEFPVFKPDIEVDYIVSLNILNQLDVLLADYLVPYKIYSESEMKLFRNKIQELHISFLENNNSCIITDYEEMVFDKKGILKEKKNLIYTELPENKSTRKWQWSFDTTGSYNEGCTTVFNVIATQFKS